MLKNLDVYPLIIAGGSGTRLWPLSRSKYPKQFHKFFSEDTLLQTTIKRLSSLGNNPFTIVCNKDHRFIVTEQLEQIKTKATLILEPVSRNTAPAITLGAVHLMNVHPETMMLILPADHWISDENEFIKAIELAKNCVADGHIVTFGITPQSPETGYGYIEVGPQLQQYNELGIVHQLLKFVEKPDVQTAHHYLQSGNYVWNSGMFCCTVDTFLSALKHYYPDILNAAQRAYEKAKHEHDWVYVDTESFAQALNISIDHAIMEKIDGTTLNAVMIPLNLDWSDVGSWNSIWKIADKDEYNNATYGDVMIQESKNCYIHAEDRLVAAVGMQDCIIIETNDAVLVANINEHQAIRQVVEKLKKETRSEHVEHLLVHKPWGSYQQLVLAERHQVKRIIVKPHASLSLQMHYHRAEHWVVVKGTARITRDKETFLLYENQSTYIPCGTFHRLENPGTMPLEIIEIQSGSYLGEDDIVRFQDEYGRVEDTTINI